MNNKKRMIIGYRATVMKSTLEDIEKIQEEIDENWNRRNEMNKMDSETRSILDDMALKEGKEADKTWKKVTSETVKLQRNIETENKKMAKKIEKKIKKKIYKPMNQEVAKRLRIEKLLENLETEKLKLESEISKVELQMIYEDDVLSKDRKRQELASKRNKLKRVITKMSILTPILKKLLDKTKKNMADMYNVAGDIYDPYEIYEEKKGSLSDEINKIVMGNSENNNISKTIEFDKIVRGTAEKSKTIEFDKINLNKPQENKPQANKPQENKPQENKSQENKTQENKPQASKPQENKTQENKSQENKTQENKPQASKPQENKPQASKPQENKLQENKPQEQKVEKPVKGAQAAKEFYSNVPFAKPNAETENIVQNVEETEQKIEKEKISKKISVAFSKLFNKIKGLWYNMRYGSTGIISGINKKLLSVANKTVEKLGQDEVTFEKRREEFKNRYTSTLTEEQQNIAKLNAEQKQQEQFEQENELDDSGNVI